MYRKIIAVVALLSQLSTISATEVYEETNSKYLRRKLERNHSNPIGNNNVKSPAMTSRPSAAPTNIPTKAPTRNPTESPTRRPTVSPTAKPTYAPTSSICHRKDGIYGSSSNTSKQIVTYYYEISLSSDNQDSISTALAKVEAAMATSLIQSVDSSCGGSTSNRVLSRILSESDILGLSPNPADTVLSNKVCGSIDTPGCKVVKGNLTIYLSSQTSDMNSTLGSILTAIKAFMENQNSNEVSLHYLDKPPVDGNVDGGFTTLADGAGAGRTGRTGSFTLTPVLASVACAFIVVGVYAGRRSIKSRRDEKIEKQKYLDGDDDNSVIEDVGLNSFGTDFEIHNALTVD